MANWQLNKTQIVERGIPERIANKETLTGLAEIAAYMGCCINKVRYAIREQGFPAAPLGATYVTTKDAVNQWVQRKHLALVERMQWDIKAKTKAKERHYLALERIRNPYNPIRRPRKKPFPIDKVIQRIKA